MPRGSGLIVLDDGVIRLATGRTRTRTIVGSDERIDASSLHEVRFLDLLNVNPGIVDVAEFKGEIRRQLLIDTRAALDGVLLLEVGID